MAKLQRSILAQVSEPQREFFVWEVTTGQGDLQQGMRIHNALKGVPEKESINRHRLWLTVCYTIVFKMF